ncbi:Fe2+-dicitrate sensor, membrane component [Sphingobium herbicidovorans NBRC 16415]|uniref:Fe2+-dicitrate sensor, membrane component n=1 Tax=Sphingobium herbicidovorans (strain ATCC 700291 / DSM 11019 / CCUG 56400 / KCTC 2939 / LMG 18315 / NBRC 16415 / MH) TaxID=1219045 RepID=A0A086P7R7_SPHHM|nr:FecR domain-containing protein [Sphingobium herbicidovorans]KFG89435.1 Fe2+-dicitrate sensor, membrane component [Sphingobium herbicidovorans NBRC 16415]
MTHEQREAADWAARMRGDPSDADRRSFDAWRAAPGHAEAYARAVDDWAYSAGTSRQRIEAKARSERNAPGSLRWAVATIAAIGLAIGFAFYLQSRGDTPQIAAGPMLPGQLKLADGSAVTLMDGAWVNPQLSDSERRVILNGGRARFDVAHDPARPFVVVAGGSETVALGTVFEVDLRQAAPRITLIKGAVEVRSRAGGDRLRLAPGQAADVIASGPQLVTAMQSPVPATLLDADELPLGAVLAAANKAGAAPIRLADPALAGLKVTGRFDVTDSRSLARTLAVALDLAASEQGGEIVLTKK